MNALTGRAATVRSGSTVTGLKPAEFRHLALDEICREAGSLNNLKNINPDLYGDMLFFRNDEGQHKYMGETLDQTEQMLRDAFPGESKEFYKYGKWAGGAWDTPEFNHLVSDEEKRAIIQWMRDRDL